MNCVLVCRPVSSRIITLRLRATPFNITVIQTYAPTTYQSDSEVEDFYDQLQEVIDHTPSKDILIVQGDWNEKVGKEAMKDGPGRFFGEYSWLPQSVQKMDVAPYRWTTSQPAWQHLSTDRSGIDIARTRSLAGADVSSDHDLLMMTFRTRLNRTTKPNSTRLKFDLDR